MELRYSVYSRNYKGKKQYFIEVSERGRGGKKLATRKLEATLKREAYKEAEGEFIKLQLELTKKATVKKTLLVDYILDFWREDSEYFVSRRRLGHTVSREYIYGGSLYAKKIAAFFDSTKLIEDLKPADIEAFLQTLMKNGFTPAMQNKVLEAIRAPINYYCKTNMLQSPMQFVFSTKVNKRRRDTFSTEEIKKLLSAQYDDIRVKAAIYLAALGGMRLGEVRGLRWCNIDFLNKKIYIKENFSRRDGLKPPKCGSFRTVPLTIKLENILVEVQKLWPSFNEGYVLLARELDRPVAEVTIRKGFEAVLKQQKINRSGRLLTFHSLRHYFITSVQESGLPAYVAQALAGHKNLAMTEHYTHAENYNFDEIIKRLEAGNQ